MDRISSDIHYFGSTKLHIPSIPPPPSRLLKIPAFLFAILFHFCPSISSARDDVNLSQ